MSAIKVVDNRRRYCHGQAPRIAQPQHAIVVCVRLFTGVSSDHGQPRRRRRRRSRARFGPCPDITRGVNMFVHALLVQDAADRRRLPNEDVAPSGLTLCRRHPAPLSPRASTTSCRHAQVSVVTLYIDDDGEGRFTRSCCVSLGDDNIVVEPSGVQG